MIISHGNKWAVVTKDGKKILGIHDTYEEALIQLHAIEAAKHKRDT